VDPSDTTQFLYSELAGDISGTVSGTTIGADKVLESHLKAVNSATDEYVLTYESTTGDFEWEVDTDTTYTAGDFLTLTSTDLDWDGMQMYMDGTDLGYRQGISWSEDFSNTYEPACVGGTDAGEICADTAGDTDCAGGGDCVADQIPIIALEATVYRTGTAIVATDMPATGVVNFGGLTSLEIPNSTTNADSSASAGVIHFDTNGETSTVPMVSVATGSANYPMRTCWMRDAGGLLDSATSPTYITPGGYGTLGSQHGAIGSTPVPITINNMACQSHEDATANFTFTFEKAAKSSCAASANGGLITSSGCTWSATGTPTCTITGTGAATEFYCTAATSDKLTIATTDFYHIKVDFSGTTFERFFCTWMECADDVW
jgi:hypothetical protein